MSDFKRIPILVDAATGKQIDEFGSVIRENDYFRLLFDETVILCCQFYDVNWIDGVAELNPHRVNPTLTFAALGDSDFDPTTPYMFLSEQSQDESNTVNLIGDWFNDETANPLDGQLSFRVDTNTERFTEALQNSSTGQSFYFCITAVPSGQTATTVLAYFKFKAENRPAASTGSPVNSDPEYLNAQEVQALVKSAPIREFSIDGATIWHSTQDSEDRYYREQRNGGEWSEAVALVPGPEGAQGIAGIDGTDGADGTSAYQAWLDLGNSGTEADFIASLQGAEGPQGPQGEQGLQGTPGINGADGTDGADGASAYQTWLGLGNSGTEADFIASMAGADGTDGSDGAAGADGTDAFVYVAYASDNTGTAFSLTPSDTLKYRAEIHSATEIANPSASDFSGATWVKYIGDDGINGTDGADGADGTNFTVDATGLLSEKSNYDTELEGFAFLATDTGDLYLKNSDTSDDWSNAIPFQGPAGSDGADGASGDSAYQTWLGLGNSGTEADFIASLTGADGVNGSDGAAGTDGTDAFVYIAYASDNTGTDFNLTPSDTLKYRAEIHSTTEITGPSASDFSGATWVKYIGDDGTGGGSTSPITLPASGSVTINASLSDKFILSPAGAVNLSLSNFSEGSEIFLKIENGGSYISWIDTIKWDTTDAFIPPTLQVAGYDVIRFVKVSDAKYVGEHFATYDVSVATSYDNTGGMGNRLSIIPYTVNGTVFRDGYSPDRMLDGAGDVLRLAGADQTGNSVVFDFGSPKCIQAVRDTVDDMSYCPDLVMKFQASTDNVDYVDIGDYDLGTAGGWATVENTYPANNTFYRYYRILFISGVSNINTGFTEIEFKISE